MLYLADVVLPISAPPLLRGAVRVEGAEVVAVGRQADLGPLPGEEVTDLGASTLLPGLINAHCHLDFTRFKGALSARQGFTEWIKTINALRRSFTTLDYIESIPEGFTILAHGRSRAEAISTAVPRLVPRLPMPRR